MFHIFFIKAKFEVDLKNFSVSYSSLIFKDYFIIYYTILNIPAQVVCGYCSFLFMLLQPLFIIPESLLFLDWKISSFLFAILTGGL